MTTRRRDIWVYIWVLRSRVSRFNAAQVGDYKQYKNPIDRRRDNTEGEYDVDDEIKENGNVGIEVDDGKEGCDK